MGEWRRLNLLSIDILISQVTIMMPKWNFDQYVAEKFICYGKIHNEFGWEDFQ